MPRLLRHGAERNPVAQSGQAKDLRPLSSMENVWQCMRDNWLSNRVFQSYEAILDHCCDTWDRLVDQP
jgi:hypothetical protein